MGKYVDVNDVPVIGPDPYDEQDKRDAIANAEAKLEADVNNGKVIDEPEQIHQLAANSYASFILATGPTAPSDVHSGDFADDDVGDFANRLRDMYRSARSAIQTASEDEGGASSHVQLGGSR